MSSEALQPYIDPENGVEHDRNLSRDMSFPPAERPDAPAGASSEPISESQWNVLNADIRDDELDVKPDSSGAVYMSHVHVRRRLNDAFRPLGWALVPVTDARFDPQSKVVVQWWDLFIGGRFCSRALGGVKYLGEENENMTYDDAVEGAKSNALMRACKDLGVAWQCWDRKFADAWRQTNCVKVWVKGKNKPLWRRIDGVPFFNETGTSDDSPNRDRYAGPKSRGSKPEPTDKPKPTPAAKPAAPAAPTAKPEPKPEPKPDAGRFATQPLTPRQIKDVWIAFRALGLQDEILVAEIKRKGYNSTHEIQRKDLDHFMQWIDEQRKALERMADYDDSDPLTNV